MQSESEDSEDDNSGRHHAKVTNSTTESCSDDQSQASNQESTQLTCAGRSLKVRCDAVTQLVVDAYLVARHILARRRKSQKGAQWCQLIVLLLKHI